MNNSVWIQCRIVLTVTGKESQFKLSCRGWLFALSTLSCLDARKSCKNFKHRLKSKIDGFSRNLEHAAQICCKNSNDKKVGGGLLVFWTLMSQIIEQCPQKPGTEVVNKPGHNLESLPPPPLFIQLSSCSATPLLLAHPQAFCHYHIDPHYHTNSVNPDLQLHPIFHSYGLDCRSPEDVAKKTFLRHDEALLAEYIRSNSKLKAQLEFMKNR